MFTSTLSNHAQKTLGLLGKSKVLDQAYLAGGSALALYFGHRISVDFDFFTTWHFNSQEIAEDLGKIGKFETSERKSDTLLGSFQEIRFSLFYYKYPLLFPTIDFNDVKLADPRDIAAMKVASVMDRGTKKDFIDLYVLAKNGVSLDDCLSYYDQKYQALASNLYSLIVSLSYFVDAENTQTPQMLMDLSWEEVKNFFEQEAKRLASKYL